MDTQPTDTSGTDKTARPYQPPTVTVLGTLAELTAGGDIPTVAPDGYGYAGASGTLAY